MLEAAIPSHIRHMSTNSTGGVRIIGVIDTGIAEDKIPLLPDVRRARSCTQKSRERGTPGEVGYEASTRKPVRQSPITVRLGTDSVNPFRREICRSFVIVALKPQTAKPPARVSTCDGPVLLCAHYACTCAFSDGRARNRMLRVVRAFLSRGVRAGPLTRQMPGQ